DGHVTGVQTCALPIYPGKRFDGRFHFRAPAEMLAVCKEHPGWLRHTFEIAERCSFEFPFGKPQFPAFRPPDGSLPSQFLRRLVRSEERRVGKGVRARL